LSTFDWEPSQETKRPKPDAYQQELDRLKAGYQPEARIADEDRVRFRELSAAIARTEEAITDLRSRIAEQESLESELISLKFKATRTEAAHTVLDGVEFEICPACGSDLPERGTTHFDHCYLCKTPSALQPSAQPKAVDIVRQDLDARIADLKDSLTRHRRALQPLRLKEEALRAERREVDGRISTALRSYESEFLARSRANEKRLSAIQGRATLLEKIREMPAEIARVQEEADALSARIDGLRRRIIEEEAKLISAERNYKSIERNYKAILRAIDFPGVADSDEVVINRRTLIPEIWQSGDEARSWNFYDAGSGGKKTLLKICFALALHQTAAENDLPVPSLLMIDSPMKNITPDVNPTIFRNFYVELYRLMSTALADWQVILIDQTYAAPPETLKPSMARLMKRADPENPPLIGYYQGA